MQERYENINGLRVISAICIMMLHVYANSTFELGESSSLIISSWTHFTTLFFMISGFGMFCGYYKDFRQGKIQIDSFYKKRYRKILPFFITLILFDLIVNFKMTSLFERIIEVTMTFGLLPNNQLSVIGVGWTLGVIFLFYLLFPFFVFLCWDKKRALFSFGCSLVVGLLCQNYFFTSVFVKNGYFSKANILYSAAWIICGCVVYMYRHEIKKCIQKIRWFFLLMCFFVSFAWYYVPKTIFQINIILIFNCIVFSMWLMYAISVNSIILSNKVMSFLSSISFEIYLSHMMIYRILGKIGFLYFFGNKWFGYVSTSLFTFFGSVIFIKIWEKGLMLCKTIIIKNEKI